MSVTLGTNPGTARIAGDRMHVQVAAMSDIGTGLVANRRFVGHPAVFGVLP